MSPDRATTIVKLLFAVEKERKSERILKSSMCQSDMIVHKGHKTVLAEPVTQSNSATGVMQ